MISTRLNNFFYTDTEVFCYSSNHSAPSHLYINPLFDKNLFLYKSVKKQNIDIYGVDNVSDVKITWTYKINKKTTHLIWSESDHSLMNFSYEGIKWSYRELMEFFNVEDLSFNDTRNILQDYSITWNPLKKDFPVEGESELYFNFFSQTPKYIPVNYIEL